MNIGVEKLDTHEGVIVKMLLDSGAMGMFMDKRTAARHGFTLQKLERPIMVRNIDGTNNSAGAITHQVEVNVYYRGHVERMRMNICDLGKTEVAHPKRGKVQQSGTGAGVPGGTAREEGRQREVRRTFKMLREVWLNIEIEKIDTHEGVAVKALLDSDATEMFMDKRTAVKHGFILKELEKSIMVRNVNGTDNSGGAITHQVEANVYYKSHIERMRMDVCDLGKMEVILGMPWLQAHNPEIN